MPRRSRPTTYRDLLKIRDEVGAGSLGQVPVVWGVDPRHDLVRIIAQVGAQTVAFCTSGYHNASRNTILTAGHCFPSGTVVYQGYFDEPTSTVRYTTVFGNVGEVQWGDNRMDAEVVPNVSNLSYAVWAGTAPNPSASLPFTGRTMAVAGANVCTDGSVTG